MTFSRTSTVPVHFLAYSTENPSNELVLQFSLPSTTPELSREDALALADYIYEKFAPVVPEPVVQQEPEESSD